MTKIRHFYKRVIARSFWQEKFLNMPTPGQLTFDRTWGMIMPLLAFAVGEWLPIFAFRAPYGLLFIWGGLVTPFPQPLFIIVGIGIIVLAVWLRWRRHLQAAAGFIAGIFLFNALLALSLTLFKIAAGMVEVLLGFIDIWVDPIVGIRIRFLRPVSILLLEIVTDFLTFLFIEPVYALLGILAVLCLGAIIMLPLLSSFVYLRNAVLALRYARQKHHSALHKAAICCGFLLMLYIAIFPFTLHEKSWKLFACLHFCMGVDLSYANLSGVYIDGRTDLCYMNLYNPSGISNWRYADLRGATLSGNFRCVDLRDTDLRGADLSEAILVDKKYEHGLGVVGAKYDRHTVWPRQFSPTLNGALLVQ